MTTSAAPRLSMRQRRIIGSVIHNAFMIALCLIVVYPLIWTICSSFKTNQQIFSESPLNLLPNPLTLENFEKLSAIYNIPLMVLPDPKVMERNITLATTPMAAIRKPLTAILTPYSQPKRFIILNICFGRLFTQSG